MTLKEIIYNVKNLKAGGVQSDDAKLSDRQYAFIIDYYRAKLIRQDIDRGKSINPNLIQSLGLVPAVKVQRSEFQEIPGCDIFRTKPVKVGTTTEIALPVVLEANYKNIYTYIGAQEQGISFHRTTFHDLFWAKSGSKYTADLSKWFEHKGKIYVATPDPLQKIVIEGIFESPYRVLEFLDKIDKFDPFNFEYPISATMLDSMYKMMIDAEMKFSYILPKDHTNEGQDDQTQQ